MNATSNPARMTARNAQPPAEASPVVLKFLPQGKDFAANGVTSAQAAGFEHCKGYPPTLALLSADTREPLAVLQIENYLLGGKHFLSFAVRIEVGSGPIEYHAGSRVIDACIDFASSMQAKICDESGTPMDADALSTLENDINAAMERRQVAAVAAIPRVLQADGTYRSAPHVSFIAEYTSSRRRRLRTCYFDVAPMTYAEGWVEGFRLAGEYLEFIKRHNRFANFVPQVLAAAVECGRPGNGLRKANVAAGFMACMSEMIVFGAREAAHSAWIEAKIGEARRYAEHAEERKAERKAEFVERMRTARAAKRAAAEKRDAATPAPGGKRKARAAVQQAEEVAA